MARKFHISPETGSPGLCTAEVKCPFGGDEAHYPSAEAARAAYEQEQPSLFAVHSNGSFGDQPEMFAAADAEVVELLGQEETLANAVSQLERNIERIQAAELHTINSAAAATGGYTTQYVQDSLNLTRTDLLNKERQLAAAKDQLAGVRRELKTKQALRDDLRPSQAGPEVDPTPLTPELIESLARSATAHNYGDTTEKPRMDGEAVLIRMSSWPRAKEAALMFAKRGWVTEFTGDRNRGELIRVVNPATAKHAVRNASEFMWSPTSNSFVTDASDFRKSYEEGFTFVSQKDPWFAMRMKPGNAQVDNENDVLLWNYTPEDKNQQWDVTVFND